MKGYHRIVVGGILVAISMSTSRFLDAMIGTMKPQGLSLIAFLIILIATMFVASYLVEFLTQLVNSAKEEVAKEKEKKRTKELLDMRYDK